MRFKDEDDKRGEGDPKVTGSVLPTEYPYAVIVEDLEDAYSKMFVITRSHVYRIDPVTFTRILAQYAEGRVANDADNAPNLESVRQATIALKGLINNA
jgi:hypothetical protein